jgi:hypothetical protein
MYIIDDARRVCESGSESVTANDQHKPPLFKPAFFMFAAESAGASQQVYQVKLYM